MSYGYIGSMKTQPGRRDELVAILLSQEHHDASLQLPEAKAAIGTAMPMLTGEFSSQEVTVLGGLGL